MMNKENMNSNTRRAFHTRYSHDGLPTGKAPVASRGKSRLSLKDPIPKMKRRTSRGSAVRSSVDRQREADKHVKHFSSTIELGKGEHVIQLWERCKIASRTFVSATLEGIDLPEVTITPELVRQIRDEISETKGLRLAGYETLDTLDLVMERAVPAEESMATDTLSKIQKLWRFGVGEEKKTSP